MNASHVYRFFGTPVYAFVLFLKNITILPKMNNHDGTPKRWKVGHEHTLRHTYLSHLFN